ncbi:mechanosensitive ion channel family protein [Salicibibacter cibarius]|uniref:Mechanosensitive ion channel family protein n=1 Tax=Salicibibacter cibarius TaxID=2743000 RepID=A0A7T6Z4S2_9BACI|nr:mechanosensitive ion channel family protein [Salicibibacter cibarius]QQK76792.1 mechanosensitive ion channel family protein [Salicibibacter cibarius]
MDDLLTNPYVTTIFMIVGQLLLAIVGYFIFRAIGGSLITRTFQRMKEKRKMNNNRAQTLEKLAMNVFSYTLLFIVIVIVIDIFGLPIGPILASAGVIGLAIGFGAQGLVSDVVTGFFLLLEKQIDVEDYVTVIDLDGIVEEVGLRTTRIRAWDGTLHFIPNREITSVSNHSRGNMEAMVDVGISFNENISETMKVLQDAMNRLAEEEDGILEGPDVLGVGSIDEYDVKIRILAYTGNLQQWGIQRKILQASKEALDEAGIEIPVPQQVYIQEKNNG